MLSMIVNFVFRCAVCEGSDLGIVAVCQDSASLVFQGGGKKVGWPKDLWVVCRPGTVWVPIEPVDEYYIDERAGRAGDFCQAELDDAF